MNNLGMKVSFISFCDPIAVVREIELLSLQRIRQGTRETLPGFVFPQEGLLF